MREIMFRGKDINNKIEWHYGFLHVDTLRKEDKYYINSRISVDNPNFVEVIPESVGQFTGQNDSDGNQIFEGESVRMYGVIPGVDIDITGEVKLCDGQWVVDNGKESEPLFYEGTDVFIVD